MGTHFLSRARGAHHGPTVTTKYEGPLNYTGSYRCTLHLNGLDHWIDYILGHWTMKLLNLWGQDEGVG